MYDRYYGYNIYYAYNIDDVYRIFLFIGVCGGPLRGCENTTVRNSSICRARREGLVGCRTVVSLLFTRPVFDDVGSTGWVGEFLFFKKRGGRRKPAPGRMNMIENGLRNNPFIEYPPQRDEDVIVVEIGVSRFVDVPDHVLMDGVDDVFPFDAVGEYIDQVKVDYSPDVVFFAFVHGVVKVFVCIVIRPSPSSVVFRP